jgi:signal transduction histidine kinase
MARTIRHTRTPPSTAAKRRRPPSAASGPEPATSRSEDLLPALLQQLDPHTNVHPLDPLEAAEAVSACAAVIQRFAGHSKDPEIRQKLDGFADLLLEATDAIGKNERRWSRLAFDLHDGAQQEISALRMDLSTLSTRLKNSLEDEESLNQALVSARELDVRLRSLDAGLRELVESFDSPALTGEPLPKVVKKLVGEFNATTGIGVALTLKDDFSMLTRSQHIVVARVLAETLANARQHSGATRIRVSLRLPARRVYLVVRDNGRGFAVEKTLARASRTHRLGLIGMAERARLLGGKLDIQSAPGGPTTISLALPAGDVGDSRKAAATRRKKSVAR